MPLKVVVELQIHAVSCPGVYLTDKNDVYLHVCILGQRKETDCLPPIFPLLFHERMWFEKIFEHATDPVAVVEQLEKSVAKFQLSELIPSEKENIAFYEENTRDFLFPEPKLTPTYPGVDRELLMNTHPSFPGIAPKLEFSTRTTITELPLLSRRWYHDRHKIKLQRAASASPQRRSISPAQCRATKNKNGNSLTRSLRSRSPSPRPPRRHLHELCRENHQQLSSLSLKSVKFKAETDHRPPFVVRHVDTSKAFSEQDLSQGSYRNTQQHVSPLRKPHKLQLKRALSFDSWKAACPAAKVVREPDEQDSLNHDSSSPKAKEFASYLSSDPTFCHEASFASPVRYRSPTHGRRWASPQHSIAAHASEDPVRILSSPNSSWEEINERVRNLLTSDEARQRLSILHPSKIPAAATTSNSNNNKDLLGDCFSAMSTLVLTEVKNLCLGCFTSDCKGATDFEIDDVLERRSISLRSSPQCDSVEQRYYL